MAESQVDLLRKAATVMRDRAEVVQTGRGYSVDVRCLPDEYDMSEPASLGAASQSYEIHLLHWSPAAALAVAELLESQADLHEGFVQRGVMKDHDRASGDERALAVARAYLATAHPTRDARAAEAGTGAGA